jgi:3',5'-cyclic AMP phosphodiesterase CpdA
MGHAHPARPFVSRREFLKRAGLAGAAIATGPTFWRQLAYAADAPALARHVNFGADPSRQMTVSWMTPAPVQSPFVELSGTRVAAETQQYDGYPGFFHHAEVVGLQPASTLTYRVGQAGAVVSSAATLRTAPSGRVPFTFTAFGDQGVDPGTAQGLPRLPGLAHANTELARRMDPALHLIVGDLAYANGDQAVWDTWFAMIEPMAASTPWMPCIGNHEIESQLDPTHGWGRWGYDPYRTRFRLPTNGYADLRNCFYAFRYGSVGFLMLDNNDVNSEVTNNAGYTAGRQRIWVEGQLAAFDGDPTIDLIVVGMHQCAFSSSTKHGSDDGVRAAWFDLFKRYRVDLVLQGHDHVYERTHTMRHDEVASNQGPYRTDQGTVYITVGNGGAVQEPFQPQQPAWSAYRQALKVGTLQINVDPFAPGGMVRMTLGEYWALDGSPIESGIVLERPVGRAVTQAA